MGTNVDNIPWPKRSGGGKARKSRSGGSGKQGGSIGAMAVLVVFGIPLIVVLLVGSYMVSHA
jgi:hypothetical protein